MNNNTRNTPFKTSADDPWLNNTGPMMPPIKACDDEIEKCQQSIKACSDNLRKALAELDDEEEEPTEEEQPEEEVEETVEEVEEEKQPEETTEGHTCSDCQAATRTREAEPTD